VKLFNSLKQVHIITVAFTYEELDARDRAIAFDVLMSTVAEQSLKDFLEEQDSDI
jgi:hypothetical protein